MSNTDLSRLINSDEVQRQLRRKGYVCMYVCMYVYIRHVVIVIGNLMAD